jgi:hypothetical protein
MKWMIGADWTLAYGRTHGYLVVTTARDVRLSRFNVLIANEGLAARLATGVVRTVIIFPLGRGPGRPGGAPELAALAESAKGYAERYDAGESLEGYPAWQHVTDIGQVQHGHAEHMQSRAADCRCICGGPWPHVLVPADVPDVCPKCGGHNCEHKVCEAHGTVGCPQCAQGLGMVSPGEDPLS